MTEEEILEFSQENAQYIEFSGQRLILLCGIKVAVLPLDLEFIEVLTNVLLLIFFILYTFYSVAQLVIDRQVN